MEYKDFNGYSVSKLALGTIQLGMAYGIANEKGAPGREEAFALLDAARKEGITTFDTARTYGQSENVLGDYFGQRDAGGDLIVTKFKYDLENGKDVEAAWRMTRESVQQSLDILGLGRIPLLLYHHSRLQPADEVLAVVPLLLRRLKEEGLISHGGISLDASKDAAALADEEAFEVFQTPLNVLDQKVLANGILERLHSRGKLVFVRSVFLQGLFFRDPDTLSGIPALGAPYLRQLRVLADRYRMSIAEMAFGFVRDLPGVSSMVIGAEDQSQIDENLRLLRGAVLPEPLMEALKRLSLDVPDDLIIPGRWG